MRRSYTALILTLGSLSLALVACSRIVNPNGWSGPTVADQALFVGTMEGRLVALDPETGETLWSFEVNGDRQTKAIYGSPAVGGDAIYIGDYSGSLHALSPQGDLLWTMELGGQIVGSPVVADGVVLVGSSDGYLYAVDPEDEKVAWRFKTGNKVWSTPLVWQGTVYFGSLDHNLYALRLEDGGLLWQFETNGAITARPVLRDGALLVGSFDGVFYAVDAATGRELWRFDGAESWFWADPVASDAAVFAPNLDGNLYALDIATGRLLWKAETGGPIVSAPALVDGRVAFASDDGRVRTVRQEDGGDERRCNIGSRIRAPLAQRDDIVYLSAQDRSIRALRVKANGALDELWAHFTDREDPTPPDYTPAC